MGEILKPEPRKTEPINVEKKGCPMLSYLEPVIDQLTRQPSGIRLRLPDCAGKTCRFYNVEYDMCGIDIVIEACLPDEEPEAPVKEEKPQ